MKPALNGQKAGLGYFYFDKHKLIGLCYAAKDTNKIYSLNNRNVFKRSVDFKTFENEDNDKGTFKERRIRFTESGFTSLLQQMMEGLNLFVWTKIIFPSINTKTICH